VHHWRRSIASFVWLVLAALVAPGVAARTQTGVYSAVDGRLGGTLQTFVERFGEPIGANEAAGTVFNADGYGPIFVQVDHVQGTADLDGRARSILTGAPRQPDRPASEPDTSDWTLAEARARALLLLPRDAELSDFVATEAPGQLAATCQSNALEELFGVLTLGQCRVTVIQPTPDSVSFVTLSLITGSALDAEWIPAANPCEDALAWIQEAGARLAEARGLLEAVAATDENDPGAVVQLREIAGSFERLLEEQRDGVTPTAAVPANDLIVTALDSYAAAVSAAAAGLETGDADLIQDAIAGIEKGNDLVALATTAIEETATACRLELGAPEPAASPAAD
jgi:hypothetical protein